MLSIADLRAAGERAAAQPVAPAPPIETLEREVARRQHRRRATVVVSTVAMTAAAGVVAVAVIGPSDAPVAVVADQLAEPAGTAASADLEPSGNEAPAVPAPLADGALDLEGELLIGGELDVAVRVVEGDEAAALAAEAAGTADEARTVDGVELWIERTGDRATVSALVEPDAFVQLTGPAELVEWLSGALADGGMVTGPHGEGLGDWSEWLEDFEHGEGLEDWPEWLEDFEQGDGLGDWSEWLEDFEHGEGLEDWPEWIEDFEHIDELGEWLEERRSGP